MRKASIGQRGKYAEGQIKKFLLPLANAYADFDWERLYDARSAGGRFPSQTGDFAFYRPQAHGVIEAKEVEHDSRIARDKISQLPRLRVREMAGGTIVVLVYHTTIERWRMVPFKWLCERQHQPSWDLADFPTYSRLDDIPGLLPALIGLRGLAKK